MATITFDPKDPRIIKKIELLTNTLGQPKDIGFSKHKTPTTVSELNDVVKSVVSDFDKKYSSLTNLMIGIIIVMGLALLGRLYDSIFRSYSFREDLLNQINVIKNENSILKSDIVELDKKYDYVNNKLDLFLFGGKISNSKENK